MSTITAPQRADLLRCRAYIDGGWHDASDGEVLLSYDPSDGTPWASIPRCGAREAAQAAAAARRAATEGPWSRMRPTERGRWLRRIGDAFAGAIEHLARMETRDHGKRLVDARAQLQDLPEYFHYFAGLADKFEGSVVPIDKPDTFNYTTWEPYGVVAAITAWNSPLALLTWKIAPALAAGNTVVAKPSEHASVSTLELMRILEPLELPSGVLNVVTGLGSEVGEALVTDGNVARVTFTGSVSVGRHIAELAGRHLKRVTLELGGKSAQIVLPDANLENAVNGVLSGIVASNGQSCVAGSRLLVHASLHDAFVATLLARIRGLRFGSPLEPGTHIAPIANEPHYRRVLEHIAVAREEGARCVHGGEPVPRDGGWYISPAIFTGVTPSMRIAREEIFGPVLAVMAFDTDEQALALANDSELGLAAGVWTENLRRALWFAQRLQVGTVYVNNYRGVAPQSPCGGYKHSGWGRENGIEAMREFLQQKSVWLGLGAVAAPFA